MGVEISGQKYLPNQGQFRSNISVHFLIPTDHSSTLSDAAFASVTFGVAVAGECDPCPSVDLFALALG